MEPANAKRYLRAFDFKRLFLEELGWDALSESLRLEVEGQEFVLQGVAHKRGMVALLQSAAGAIPPYAMRRKIERQVSRAHREHLIVYVDGASQEQVWQWVRQEIGKPLASREHHYHVGQPGDLLLQKLAAIAFSLDEEEGLILPEIIGRVRAAFDVERVTRRFYDQFKRERDAFEQFLKGVPDGDMARWYVSVMLNRLMFIYFIQKKGLLNGDADYLRNRLFESRYRAPEHYYREFLCPLFFQGFAQPSDQRSPEVRSLLGNVPYLNGGIFQRHEVEERCGRAIDLPDAAFERLFGFFEQYQWHLDDRPLRQDNEINPDVLGYIFEKYINQKQMGAYYTQEDITGYNSRNTVIPFLFDAARKQCRRAFEGEGSVWRLLRDDPDRYFYPAMVHGLRAAGGTLVPLPPEIEAGIADVGRRAGWNRPTAERFALPTEIWRETVARRQRYLEVREKLAAGQVHDINDLITYNLDIQQFAQDVIETCDDPALLRAFWKAIIGLSALDPTVGSGAFLFAVLNVLEPLYEACLDRMQAFLAELPAGASPQKYGDFRQVLAQVERHPNRKYYVFKSIIVNNLYGVDIMAEAVEIARLRLFLKLVAQVESADHIEPLPDIDFNIQVGNTLVGFTTREQVQAALRSQPMGAGVQQDRLLFEEDEARLRQIEEQAGDVDRLYRRFREMQTADDAGASGRDQAEAKAELRRRLRALEDELNRALAGQYGVDADQPAAYERWLASHQPFHWFVEFYGIMRGGGFDVIVGNPPYIELKAVREYQLIDFTCTEAGNLYALVMERSTGLCTQLGRQGFIVPVSSVSTDRYACLQRILQNRDLHYCSFDDRPSRLFDGLEHCRLTIHLIGRPPSKPQRFSTRYNKWFAVERSTLFERIRYASAPGSPVDHSLPKLTSEVEHSLVAKLSTQKRSLGQFAVHSSSHQVFYSRKIGYFLQALDFVPRVLDGQGRLRAPSEFKELCFASTHQARMALCCLNSHLFYWFITVFSDCRHVNKREVRSFPVDLDRLTAGDLGPQLAALAQILMDELKANSEDRVMRFEHDTLTVQAIFPRASQPTIAEMDRVLAQHFGFTDEELDFIINYDIKYRMGDELPDDEDEEE